MAATLAEVLATAALVQMLPEQADPAQVAPAILIAETHPATDAQVQAVPATSIEEMPPATDAQVRAAPVTEVRLAEDHASAVLVTLDLGTRDLATRDLEMAESRGLAPHEQADPATLALVVTGPATTGRPAEAKAPGTAARATAITEAADPATLTLVATGPATAARPAEAEALGTAARATATTEAAMAEAAEPAVADRSETHRGTAAPGPEDLVTTAGQGHALARDRTAVTTPGLPVAGLTVTGLGAE